jgi:hypothetical protein
LITLDTLLKRQKKARRDPITARSKVMGFKAEQLDKLLVVKACEIIKDTGLYPQLQRILPKFVQSLALRIKSHGLGVGRKR